MSILINKNTRVITQGITGKTGAFHTEKCQEYAAGQSCFVAGVNPKKSGESLLGIPIFASVKECAGYPVASIFDTHDLPDYETYDSHSCPWCRQGKKIDALVNSFGYSSL